MGSGGVWGFGGVGETTEGCELNLLKKLFTVQMNCVNETQTGTCAELLNIFNQKLDSLAKHHYNWLQKAKECRALKESLREDEIALHVDFSENFSCKLNSELQAFHFGESRKQATVHTCGLYSSRLYQASPSLHPLGMIRELCGLTWSQC